MKTTAVLLTVILLVTGMFSCITKDKAEAYIPDESVLPEKPMEDEKVVILPQLANKREAAPRATTFKLKKPHFNKIELKGDSVPYCGVAPMVEEDSSDSFIMCNLATEAEYPGGATAWQYFLKKNMCYPEDVIEIGIVDSVVVQFVVDEDGMVSNVEAVCGSWALSKEAVRVIKRSGRWTPGRQAKDGRYVKSYKRQPFIIRFEEE